MSVKREVRACFNSLESPDPEGEPRVVIGAAIVFVDHLTITIEAHLTVQPGIKGGWDHVS